MVFIYAFLPYHDLGLAILVLTLLVRIALHPTIVQTFRSQQAMVAIAPRLKAIKEKFKNDKEEQARQTMALYREHGIHPLSGCIPLIIQIPVLIGLYRVFLEGITLSDSSLLYSFAPHINAFNPISFGLINLAKPSIVLALAAGATQLLQGWFLPKAPSVPGAKDDDFARALRWQSAYLLPAFVVFIAIKFKFPAALTFYWTILNLFAIIQQLWIQKRLEYERNSRSPQSNS